VGITIAGGFPPVVVAMGMSARIIVWGRRELLVIATPDLMLVVLNLGIFYGVRRPSRDLVRLRSHCDED